MSRMTAGKPVPKWMAGKYYSEEELYQMMKHSHDPIPRWKLQKEKRNYEDNWNLIP